jgi:hypothetical protein
MIWQSLVLFAVVGLGKPFSIEIVDDQTGRGVPLVEAKTVNDIIYVTDSNGRIAFNEPGLVGRRVFLHIKSHGYEYPKDGFGFRGVAIKVTEGGHAQLKLHRINIAERLYRVTGGGAERDTILLGLEPSRKEPLLNGEVLGSDSVVNVIHNGKLHWFWGDTNRPSYPLGNFQVPGATSLLPKDGGLDPAKGVDLTYYIGTDGFAKETCHMPGPGPTWIGAAVELPDENGVPRIYAHYVKVRNYLEVYEQGLVVWNDDEAKFDKFKVFDRPMPNVACHPFRHEDGGVEYLYLPTPYPYMRVKANVQAFSDPGQYEAFTPLKAGSDPKNPVLDRDDSGKLRLDWKLNAPLLDDKTAETLTAAGAMNPEDSPRSLKDAETGKPVRAHGGSVYWNAYRKRWVMIFVEMGGTSSLLGEVWYAEAETPTGPWTSARKIATHDKYSFYNPKQHPYFDQNGGRVIYFEGTYTATFSGNPSPTPRYEYNQVMYRLDLSDPRLKLPPVN